MTDPIDPKISIAPASGSAEQVLTNTDLRRLIRDRKKTPPQEPTAPATELVILGVTEWDRVVVEHRAGCGCSEKEDGVPAFMYGERVVASGDETLDALAAQGLYDSFKDALERRARPMGRITEERFNECGHRIGPRLEVRSCEAAAYYDLREQVAALVERAADLLSGITSAEEASR